MATVDLGQLRATGSEPALVTAGNEVATVARLARDGEDYYRAEDVLHYLRGA